LRGIFVKGRKVAHIYAGALLEIGQERNTLDQIEEELKFLSGLLSENKSLMQYFNSPGISVESKMDFVDRILQGKLSEISINFLKLLIDNGRQSIIDGVYESLIGLIDEVYNRQRVVVVTSKKLEEGTLEELRDLLKDKYKKDVILLEEIDESILGGIILKIGDLIIDGSLANDLKNIERNLLYRKVRSESSYED
jgi:F-type H+-transporting ATPase subunit delta